MHAPTSLRLAFAGFQHNHILSLHTMALDWPGIEVVAACEADPKRAAEIEARGDVKLTHHNLQQMLREVQCDAVAIGDIYALRGEVAIACLEAGKHIISDKPLCTRLSELERITALAAEKRLAVGCQLELRSSGSLRTLRRLIRSGVIGTVHTISTTAQHPLLLGTRPNWYFQPGMQGGTFNDIAIHGLDAVPWITGRRPVEAIVARSWNARLPQYPFFEDAAQFMLRLDNDGGMLGDVSYLAPDGCGYSAPQYWRFTCHGDKGVLEAQADSSAITLACGGDQKVETIACDPPEAWAYLRGFLDEIAGIQADGAITTSDVITATRQSLLIQQAADEKRFNMPLV